jgi:hypothetical protein
VSTAVQKVDTLKVLTSRPLPPDSCLRPLLQQDPAASRSRTMMMMMTMTTTTTMQQNIEKPRNRQNHPTDMQSKSPSSATHQTNESGYTEVSSDPIQQNPSITPSSSMTTTTQPLPRNRRLPLKTPRSDPARPKATDAAFPLDPCPNGRG